MDREVKERVAGLFLEMAQGIETGAYGARPKIAIMGAGSEHGEENILQGAVLAASEADVTYIGTLKHEALTCVNAANEEECQREMEHLLDSGAADGAVAMHYPFPIGVSTVGRVQTPGKGREIYIATTTGTSSTDRTTAMVLNAVYGVIAAKACGVKDPSVGFLNIDGAKQAERAVRQLAAKGYAIRFAESERADGGCILRGNDVLTGAADVVVADSLTGNVLIKLLSSFTTGGSYESVGCGYGPGIGRGYGRLVMIISRASGAPVVAGAIRYAAALVRGGYAEIAKREFAAADMAGLESVLAGLKRPAPEREQDTVKPPPEEVVTGQISGIEVMELDDAVQTLWKAGIYAQSGMGCTGPVVLVAEDKLDNAAGLLAKAGFIQG